MSLVTVQITQYIIDNTELPVSTYDPFDGAHGSLGYWIMYFYQCVAMSMACFFNISFDSLCCSLFIFVRCQLDILALRLQSIGHNCNGVEESVEEVEHQLKNCIRLHMKIVELAADIEAVLYLPMSIQIMFSVLVLTSGFYAISLLSDEKLIFLKFFIYQSCMLTQVFVLCYFPGEVAQRSLKLSHDLYKSNWVNWQRSNRRLLLMLMQRLDIPIRIRTLDASLGFDLALFTSELTASFYKYQVWYLKLLGVWSLQDYATRQQRVWHALRCGLIFVIVSIMLLFFAIHVLANIDQISVILEVFFMFATELSCMTKLLSIKLKSANHARILTLMHSTAFQPISSREYQIYMRGAARSVKWRNIYAFTSLLAASLILVTQWFVDSSALPLSMYEPCNLARDSCYYGFYLYQVLSLMPSCWLNISFDSVCGSLLFFLETQVAMLSARLQSLGAAKTPPDNVGVAMELRDCCLYYGNIVKLKEMVVNLIRVPGSVQMLCSVLVLVSNFYALSIRTSETAFMIMLGSYQFVMLMQIFIICYAADEMSGQSALLSHALYSSEWTTWNRTNRKMCLLMMLRLSKPLEVHTLDHTQSFNSLTFASIVNCSYSYFALLKRVNS
ncbi:GH21770 [Drosophila grimshawi]|uniref:GH21770 n=1 Tax=Drosophila grimshawi TaxID=7222 RepID=B4J6V3_DROGR|nr:GH21770 [Drosophila grimshawi]